MPVNTLPHSGMTPSRPSSTVSSTRSGEPPQCQMSSLRLGKPIAPCAEEPWQVAQVLLKIERPSAMALASLANTGSGWPWYRAKVSLSLASSVAFTRACSDCDDHWPTPA